MRESTAEPSPEASKRERPARGWGGTEEHSVSTGSPGVKLESKRVPVRRRNLRRNFSDSPVPSHQWVRGQKVRAARPPNRWQAGGRICSCSQGRRRVNTPRVHPMRRSQGRNDAKNFRNRHARPGKFSHLTEKRTRRLSLGIWRWLPNSRPINLILGGRLKPVSDDMIE